MNYLPTDNIRDNINTKHKKIKEEYEKIKNIYEISCKEQLDMFNNNYNFCKELLNLHVSNLNNFRNTKIYKCDIIYRSFYCEDTCENNCECDFNVECYVNEYTVEDFDCDEYCDNIVICENCNSEEECLYRCVCMTENKKYCDMCLHDYHDYIGNPYFSSIDSILKDMSSLKSWQIRKIYEKLKKDELIFLELISSSKKNDYNHSMYNINYHYDINDSNKKTSFVGNPFVNAEEYFDCSLKYFIENIKND